MIKRLKRILGSGTSRTTGSLREDDYFEPNAPNESPKYNFEDYVREVPVELFTVSKMIVTTNVNESGENSRS